MAKFSTQTQALVRGDLDTGSVMCYPSPRHDFENWPLVWVIWGHGFDTGLFVANILIGHVPKSDHYTGEKYAEWLLEQVNILCSKFCE